MNPHAEDNSDFGEPIFCTHFDLMEALQRENAARTARENQHIPEDDDHELEPAPAALPPSKPDPITTPSAPPLTGRAKKNVQKRERERTKRKEATVAALQDPTPPVPSPRALDKAAACTPLATSYRAANFRATKPRWNGLATPLEHPLLKHAHDVEILKQHMDYFDWPGDKTHVVLDRQGYVIGALVAPPVQGAEWESVAARAAAVRAARAKMTFPAGAEHHRRAAGEGFPTAATGFAFGTGRGHVGNIKASSFTNAAALDEMLGDKDVERIATNAFPAFQALAYHIFSDYHEAKQLLLQKYPHLRKTFPRSPFAALTANLGPVSVSPPHTDGNNKADGFCLINALGSFDADKGGHLVLWDYDLVVRFPAGRSALIPSAVVTHSNTPIQAGEDRFSLIQYSAGSLFRWIDNGYQSDLSWFAGASADDVARREEARRARCAVALRKFSRWKDIKVKNYAGRPRLDVWQHGDLAEFSDYTDESEGEQERPCKRLKRGQRTAP